MNRACDCGLCPGYYKMAHPCPCSCHRMEMDNVLTRSYRCWTIDEPETPDGQWTASCQCGWKYQDFLYDSCRRAVMYHYYKCPKRFELPEDPNE